MADLLSQNDLDLLWASSRGDETEKPVGAEVVPPSEGAVAAAVGITQADLDALWGALGAEETADCGEIREEYESAGLSQGDLDALWGLSSGGGREESTTTEEGPSAPIGENFSQDDIDRLLAEMGR